uniref:ATP synthase F0 subunit 8 n=1 Tax=Thuridilla gracilis TaxID=483958 RepID=E6Y1G5_9GAST|nr:ATP synthase F0 subunit 8 [Thuridilla gracilis]
MPQLSPMMGILVFLLTNLTFFILMLSIQPTLNISSSFNEEECEKSKAFRSFS